MRFLICSLDSPGFLYPCVGLALALRQRGHEVAFATNQNSEALLSTVGIERIPRGSRDGPSFQVEHWTQPLAVALQVKHIEYALHEFAPDILVSQPLALGPLIVKSRARVLVAVQGLATYLWPTMGTCPLSPATRERLLWRYQDMMGWYNTARSAFGLPVCECGPCDSPLIGDLFLLRNAGRLVKIADLPERVHPVGACLWEPPVEDEATMGWVAAAMGCGRRIAYVQPGRTFGSTSFWPLLVDALSERSISVAASINRMDTELGKFGPDTYLLRGHLSQSLILKHASLMVSHGTTTSVLGALTHSVPSLLLPKGGEQLDLAEHCERLGAAITLTDLTLENLSNSIERLLHDDRYREAARKAGQALSEIDGFGVSADLLEALVTTGKPVLRRSSAIWTCHD